MSLYVRNYASTGYRSHLVPSAFRQASSRIPQISVPSIYLCLMIIFVCPVIPRDCRVSRIGIWGALRPSRNALRDAHRPGLRIDGMNLKHPHLGLCCRRQDQGEDVSSLTLLLCRIGMDINMAARSLSAGLSQPVYIRGRMAGYRGVSLLNSASPEGAGSISFHN